MKDKSLLTGIRTGLMYGLVLIFIFLIGFTTTAADLIGKIIGNPTPLNGTPFASNFAVFLVLMGLLCGSSAVQNLAGRSWLKAAGAGLAAGLAMGLPAAATGFVFGTLLAKGIDVRTYLVSVAPETIKLFLFNSSSGAVLLFGVLTGSSFTGALLASQLRGSLWLKNTARLAGNRAQGIVQSPALARFSQNRWARYTALAALAAALIILPRQWGSYWNYVLGTVGIYIILGLGLNIITGWAGQLVIGYVAFFAIGAYTFALLTAPEPQHLQWNFWAALLVGMITAALAGLLVGLPILNLRGDYLAIVTLGFAEIVRILLKSDLLTEFTGGPRGVRDIGGPTLFGRSFNNDVDFMYLIILAVLVVTFLAYRMQYSRTGRGWVAVREDETVARATGINAFVSKLLALTLSAAIAGLAGALFASRNQFTGPDDHALIVSINVICLVIVGGIGSIPGIFLGAFALKGLPELLREVENYRMLVFGALLVVMMNIRPEGFLPATRPHLEKAPEPEPAGAVVVHQPELKG